MCRTKVLGGGGEGGHEELYQDEYIHWVRESVILVDIRVNQCVYN